MSEAALPTLSDTLKVADKTIKMSYGLMMDLQRVIPDAEHTITSVMSDSFVRDYVIRRVLTDIKGTVESEKELIASEDIELSMDEVNAVLSWAVAHLLHFFVKSGLALKAQGKLLEALTPSKPSTPGSGL